MYLERFNYYKRPTFIFLKEPVRAAGILPYYVYNDQKIYLFRIIDGNRATDIGGCTHSSDKNYFDTACREASEETNGHFFNSSDSIEKCQHKFLMLLEQNSYNIKYDKKGKYLLFELQVNMKYAKNMKRFGTMETTENMKHYYIWRPLNKIFNLHPRLKNILK